MDDSTARLPIGERLLTDIVRETALLTPDKRLASFPTSATMEAWHTVTYREMQVAVDALAWYLESVFGKNEGDVETVAYMGINDIRYPVFWLAAIKAGFATLNSSPRNSVEGHVSLLEKTGCTKFVYASEMTEQVQEIKAACGGKLDTVSLPTYEHILAMPKAGVPYPFAKTLAELRDKAAFIFHTSGSTGLPKPITLTHDYLAVMDNNAWISHPEGRLMFWSFCREPGSVLFDGMPLFHLAGASCAVFLPLSTGVEFVLQAAESPFGPKPFLELVKRRPDINMALIAPFTLEALADMEDGIDNLRQIKCVMFGGGPLARTAGDKICKVVRLVTGYGSTEAGIVSSLLPEDPLDWGYFEWNSHFGAVMEPTGDGETYELIIPRNPKYEKYHGVFKVFPELDVWRTRDLFVRHPTKPNLWSFSGRTDDVIVLSTGEKFKPIDMQYEIATHPLVKSALIAGQGRFQTSLIVEPDYTRWDAARSPQELIDEIWPTVQEANKKAAATGRIFKNKIIVAPPEKPFRRADKGTVQRARTLTDFEAELEEIYRDNSEEEAVKTLPDVVTADSMKAFTRVCLSEYVDEAKLGDDDNLYLHGMDSLQSLGFLNVVRAALGAAIRKKGGEPETALRALRLQSVYEHPSIGEMSAFLAQLLDPSLVADGVNGAAETAESREEKVARMVEKYAADVSRPATPAASKHGHPRHVILTGTTGSLGCYVLQKLCAESDVAKIYCFNRTADAAARTAQRFRESGLGDDGIPAKAVFLTVKYGDAQFGLDDATYAELLADVDLVIHNAWAVNFNHSLETFEDPHIKSVRNFVNLSLRSAYRAHIFFISSIGAVGAWNAVHPDRPVCPEELMPRVDVCLPQGYAQSKHVSERILASVAERADVPSSIARVGQIAGPRTTQGRWNDAEWFPSIVKTSKALRKLPDALGAAPHMDWIPVSDMAAACVELALGRLAVDHATPLDIFHLVNPKVARWTDLVPAVQDFFAARGAPLQVVPFAEWVAAVARAGQEDPSEQAVRQMPAIKLLDFFQDLDGSAGGGMAAPRLDVTNTAAKSSVIANLEPIGPELMRTWLTQWDY